MPQSGSSRRRRWLARPSGDATRAPSQTEPVRIEIHVRPGSSARRVGGTYDGALLVRVPEPADRGRATAAALRAVAEALAVPPGTVRLVRGASSRRKQIEITTVDEATVQREILRLQELTDNRRR